MPLIFNVAGGPRMFYAKVPGGGVGHVTLPAGGAAILDVDLEANPVYRAWADKEEILVGDDAAKRLRKLGRPVPGEEPKAEKAEPQSAGEDAPKVDGGATAAEAEKPATQGGEDADAAKGGAGAKDGGEAKTSAKPKK